MKIACVYSESQPLNPIHEGQGGRGKNVHPPVTSTKVGITPQNLLVFSFNPFATLV